MLILAFLKNNLLGYFHFSGKLRRFFLSRLFSWKVSAAFLLGYFKKKSRLFSNKKRFFFRKPSAAWPGLGYFQTKKGFFLGKRLPPGLVWVIFKQKRLFSLEISAAFQVYFFSINSQIFFYEKLLLLSMVRYSQLLIYVYI